MVKVWGHEIFLAAVHVEGIFFYGVFLGQYVKKEKKKRKSTHFNFGGQYCLIA